MIYTDICVPPGRSVRGVQAVSIAPNTDVFPSSLRRPSAVIAALVLGVALLAAHTGGTARAQSQCYNSNSGSSCTNYSSTGAVASTNTCSSEADGSSVCVTSSPGGPSHLLGLHRGHLRELRWHRRVLSQGVRS
jgi:hypothetical protein